MAHFTSITIGLSVEAEFKKILTVEQFEQSHDLLNDLVSFSMFTYNWKDAPAPDSPGYHDDFFYHWDVVEQSASDSLYALIDVIGVPKSKKIAQAMDIATGRNFGAKMFDEVMDKRRYSHPAAA